MNNIKFYPFSEKTQSFTPEPVPASKMVPEWYKRQPGSIDDEQTIKQGFATSTVKRCMPFFDLMTSGYLILSPCDIYIDSTDPEKITFSIPMPLKQFEGDMFAKHGREQYSEMPYDKDKFHKDLFRIMPFWAVETPEGYSTLFLNPVHKDPTPFQAVSAFVDTDKFISDGHLSFWVEKGFKGVVKQGTPLVQVVPIKREDWKMEIVPNEIASKRFTKQRLNVRSTFVNGYKIKSRSKKEYK